MDVADRIEDFINKQTSKVKQRVRNKAIKQVESQMILAGTKSDELDLDDWEHLIAEQEKDIWSQYQKGGFLTLIGMAFWLP